MRLHDQEPQNPVLRQESARSGHRQAWHLKTTNSPFRRIAQAKFPNDPEGTKLEQTLANA